MKRILVATDGSQGAARAVAFAAAQARAEGARLLIANVVGGYGLPDPVLRGFTRARQRWLEEMLASLSATMLEEAREQARAAGLEAVELESRRGDVAQTILEIAHDKQAEAIVVGRRGAGTLSRLLIGSVSQKLVTLAPVPVTVVP